MTDRQGAKQCCVGFSLSVHVRYYYNYYYNYYNHYYNYNILGSCVTDKRGAGQ